MKQLKLSEIQSKTKHEIYEIHYWYETLLKLMNLENSSIIRLNLQDSSEVVPWDSVNRPCNPSACDVDTKFDYKELFNSSRLLGKVKTAAC